MADSFEEYWEETHGPGVPYQKPDLSRQCLLCGYEKPLDTVHLCSDCHDRVDYGHIRNLVKFLYYLEQYDGALFATYFNSLPEEARRVVPGAMESNPHWLFGDWHHDRYQIEFLYSPKKTQAVFAGNRSGKTWDWCYKAAEWLTATCAEDYPDEWPDRFRFIAPVSGKVVTSRMDNVHKRLAPQYFAKMFPHWPRNHKSNEYWEIEYVTKNISRITYRPTGSYIDFLGVSQEKEYANLGEGDKFHWAACDEPPSPTLYEATLRGLADYRGPMIIAATPVNEAWWMKDKIEDRELIDPEIGIYRWNIWQNHIKNGGILSTYEIRRILSFNPETRIARETGQFTVVVGSYFATPLRTHPQVLIEIEPPIDEDWIALTSMDYHTATDARWLLSVVTPLDQLITLDELKFSPMLEEIADGIQTCMSEWGIKRHGDFLVDKSMSEDLKMVRDEDGEVLNPFNSLNGILVRRGMRPMNKIKNAHAAIPYALKGFEPVETLDGTKIQPFLINRLRCLELLRTLPKLRRSVVRQGITAGTPRVAPDKRPAEGGHIADCWLYQIGRRYKYVDLKKVVEYKPGTWFYLKEQQKKAKAKAMAGEDFVHSASRSDVYAIR